MNEAKANRSNAERWPRSVIAGLAAIIPAAALLRKRGRNAMWLWVSAVIYLVVFNARYAVIDGRTYSLSSVTSAMDVILYCAVTAMMALGSAWLIASIASGAFRRGARSASEFALGLTFVTAYLLLLPVLLHFALNGAIVTWALPDFLTSFLAFLSLTQLLMVAVLGLIFAGISTVIASFTKRPVRA
jgi:hypothetical protein